MIYINTKIIKKSLPTLNKIAPTKSKLKLIQNIRIAAIGDTLTMSVTDLDVAAQCRFDVPMGNADFDVLANTKKFCKIIRSIKSDTIGFASEGDKLTVHHHEGHIDFPTQNADDFPDFPQESIHHLGTISADFSMIAKSIGDYYSASMNQVAIEQNGTIAATNGYMLSIIRTDDFSSEDVFLGGDAIRKVASQLNGDIAIGNTEDKYALKCDNWTFWVPRAKGKMPNYNGVIPESFAHTVHEIGVHELLYHVSAASKVNSHEIELSINDAIEIRAESYGIKWNSRINAVIDGSEILICVDPTYLIEALTQIKKLNDTATLRIDGNMRPISLSSDCGTYQSIIMPMIPKEKRM